MTTISALLALAAALAGLPPEDLEARLRDNLDKLVFRSFSVTKTAKDEYGDWVCGAMSARIATGDYLDFRFVAQLYPDSMGRDFPKSWITLVGQGLGDPSDVYGRHCGP